jgi:hypothetical protein
MSEQQPVHRIEPGQEYERHDPRENSTTRIRVVGDSVPWWDNSGKVWIATVGPDGRELRSRWIATRQLHDNPDRVTGYRLVLRADGSPADGVQA